MLYKPEPLESGAMPTDGTEVEARLVRISHLKVTTALGFFSTAQIFTSAPAKDRLDFGGSREGHWYFILGCFGWFCVSENRHDPRSPRKSASSFNSTCFLMCIVCIYIVICTSIYIYIIHIYTYNYIYTCIFSHIWDDDPW